MAVALQTNSGKSVDREKRAVAYYREADENRWESSIQLQRDEVHEYADKHHIEIIQEFADHGRTGIGMSRPRFAALMWCVRSDNDFGLVLVLCSDRWERCMELAGFYQDFCAQYRKKVIFTFAAGLLPKSNLVEQFLGSSLGSGI